MRHCYRFLSVAPIWMMGLTFSMDVQTLAAQTRDVQTQAALPLFFIQNQNASDPTSTDTYLIRTPGMQAAFSSSGVDWLNAKGRIALRFRGANPAVTIQGDIELSGAANIMSGSSPSGWQRNLRTFQGVVYRQLYRGIDLAYSSSESSLKSQYTVAPGADPRQIRLQYSGKVEVTKEGGLIVRSENAELREKAPEIFQESSDGRKVIPGRFRKIDAHSVNFEIARYDRSKALIIDPTISYSTYLGGTGLGAVTALAVDANGNVYATGWTEALNFPIVGAAQATNRGGVDAFVVKLNSTGTTILYATYVGGRADDRAAGIAIDANGKAYITGATTSSDFPLAAAAQSSLNGSKDAFVVALSADGSRLSYSTYFGGDNADSGTAIAVDANGLAYVAGDAQSLSFPVLSAVQTTNRGGVDAFVAKFTATGQLTFSTFLGGNAADHAGGIAIDSTGNAYIAGGTYSTNFPLVTPIQASNGGTQDAFVTKLRGDGAAILYSTYLGGNGQFTSEMANAITVNASGNALVAGVTNSSNFPVTTGAHQAFYNGTQDAFICKLNPAGNGFVFSTFLGGTSFDWAWGIATDSADNVFAAGYTSSTDFASIGGVQAGFGGLYDSFVARLSSTGNTIGFSTFFGGSGSESANAIAVDANGNMFVGGQTGSMNFPLANAIQSFNNGGSVGWVARIGVTAPPAQQPSVLFVSPASGSGSSATFTGIYFDTAGAAALTTVGLLINSSASPNFGCAVTYDRANNLFLLAKDDPTTGSFSVIPGGGIEQNSQCILNGAGSSVVVSGSTITLNVSLIFLPSLAGQRSIYGFANDAGASTGFVAKGTWTVTVPPPQPSVDSVSPNNNMGASQTFTFVFSDTQNANNLTGMAMLFATNLTGVNACHLGIDRRASTVSLLWDSGLGSSSRSIVSNTVLQNSQCAVGTASITVSGLSQIVTVTIYFKGAFSGTKNIYMMASLGTSTTGYLQRGSFTVAAGGVPIAQSVVPGSGTGPSQRFSFTMTDSGGSSYLTGMAMLINSTFSTNNGCFLGYDRNTNKVALYYDTATNGSAAVIPGSATTVSNSQCILRAANTTVVVGTNSIVVTVDLTFSAGWFGTKGVWLLAAENGVNSGWLQVGAWSVSGGAPSADAVTPNSGLGNQPSFTFTVSDATSQSNVSGISMMLTTGAPTNIANACYLFYNRTNTTIGLFDDAGTTLSAKGIGSSASLQNSQCAVGYTVLNTSGNSVTFTVNLFLKPAFSGAKTVYLQAHTPAAASGWVARGTWTAP